MLLDKAHFGAARHQHMSIPLSVTELGGSAFLGCTSLATVQFNEGKLLLKKMHFATAQGIAKRDHTFECTRVIGLQELHKLD